MIKTTVTTLAFLVCIFGMVPTAFAHVTGTPHEETVDQTLTTNGNANTNTPTETHVKATNTNTTANANVTANTNSQDAMSKLREPAKILPLIMIPLAGLLYLIYRRLPQGK